MSLRKTVCAYVVALLMFLTLSPRAAHAAGADSTRAGKGVRLLSDRALIDLDARGKLSPAAARVADSLGLPSPAGATALTVGGAITPILFLAGSAYASNSGAAAAGAVAFSVIGPGLGYYYGRIGWQAVPGQLIRTGAIVLLGVMYLEAWDSDEAAAAVIPTAISAAILYSGATLYDIGNVGPAVERENQRRLAATRPDLGMGVLRDGTPALAVRLRF